MADIRTDAGRRALPRVHWAAIAAGVLVALAAQVVLGLVGGAIGLAAEPADSGALGAGAALWALLTPLAASLLGAWIACRLAEQWDVAGSNLHGVLVWCIGLLAGAIFLTGTLASGAVGAGTAASGNAGALRQAIQGGVDRAEPGTPRTEAGVDRAQDEAARRGAAALGAAAMASLAGLLGALLGAGLARARREGGREGRGLGWRISLQRTDRQHERAFGPGAHGAEPDRGREPARPYGGTGGAAGYGAGSTPNYGAGGTPGYERGPRDDTHSQH